MRSLIHSLMALSLAVTPLAPALVHAAESNRGVSVGVSVGASADVDDDIDTADEATFELHADPIVVTHESATADEHADDNAIFNRTASSTTGNATSSAARLRAHANAVAASDDNVDAVAVSDSEVAVSYREPARLFGFIKIRVPVRVSVDASGEASVSYPWYRFLMATNKESVTVRAQAVAAEHARVTGSAATTLSADAATRLIDSLTLMLQSEAEADASVEAGTQ